MDCSTFAACLVPSVFPVSVPISKDSAAPFLKLKPHSFYPAAPNFTLSPQKSQTLSRIQQMERRHLCDCKKADRLIVRLLVAVSDLQLYTHNEQ